MELDESQVIKPEAQPQPTGQAPAQPEPKPQPASAEPLDQDAIDAAWKALPAEVQTAIGQTIYQQGQQSAYSYLQEQGLIKEPEKPNQPDPEDTENRIFSDVRQKATKILDGVEGLNPNVKNVLMDLFQLSMKESVKTAAGIGEHLTSKQIAEQTRELAEWRYEQGIKEFISNNPDVAPHMDLLRPIIEAPTPNAPALIKAVREMTKRNMETLRKEQEARAKQEQGEGGGFMETHRVHAGPRNVPGRDALADQMVEAAGKGDHDRFAALAKRWRDSGS